MGESLGDILRKRGSAQQEPPEFVIIRKYVQDRFSVTPKLSTSRGGISITVPSSAVAGNLRFELYDLSQLLDTNQRLFIRIGR
jgi:hypothetical protein